MGNLRKEAIAKYKKKYPHLPDLTLAALLVRQEPALFFTIQSTRLSIQYYTGKRKNGSGNKAKEPIKSVAPVSDVAYRYRAPKTYAEPLTDFVIHGAQRILVLSDIHYPFHDEDALTAAINYGVDNDPTIVLLNGDTIDCHELSDYDRDPRRRYTDIEMKMIGNELRIFKEAFPKARIIWKEGNHEERLDRYMRRRAPELYGLPGMDIPGLVTMNNDADTMRGVEWVSGKRVIRAGHLAFLHGHEFRGGGGVNPARWLYLRTGENSTCGHFHKTSEHSETNLARKQIGAWSTGCLSELTPAYMPHNKWNHGFGWVDVQKGGNFRFKNIRIIDGKVY